MASSSCYEYSTSEEEDAPRHCTCSVNVYTSRCRCHRRAAVKPKRVVRRKLTAPVTGPCVSSATEEEEVDEVFAAAQLVDLSIDVKRWEFWRAPVQVCSADLHEGEAGAVDSQEEDDAQAGAAGEGGGAGTTSATPE